MSKKLVLAYSGGLDTSVAIHWLAERDYEVLALAIDLGEAKDLDAVMSRALKHGATQAFTVDARDLFLRHFVWPTLQAGALYEGRYPLATALGRPLIAKLMVDLAREEGATAVAHGCTGKGNDQVRFDVATGALAPDLEVVAPVREWGMTREEEIEYARQHGVEVPATVESPYSTDVNLWGRSIEAGVLEDPWQEPPADVFAWTAAPEGAPAKASYVEIKFERGIPVGLDGEELEPVELVSRLNAIGGEHGVGRIDMVENRLVGIKSREIYEAPAAVILTTAHEALESVALSKDVARFKAKVAAEWADLTYNGLWFSALRQDLAAFVASTQEHVSGEVRLKLLRGALQVVGRKAPDSLYRLELATYGSGDAFDQGAAKGFIHLWGLPLRTQARVQGLLGDGAQNSLLPPDMKRLRAAAEPPADAPETTDSIG
ncbi:MAG TPA: argininosuccinate synthase [Candidatus Solibacter sp.]|nr:argininosuccinate synthase [Candidatus Solibacter sp.]